MSANVTSGYHTPPPEGALWPPDHRAVLAEALQEIAADFLKGQR